MIYGSTYHTATFITSLRLPYTYISILRPFRQLPSSNTKMNSTKSTKPTPITTYEGKDHEIVREGLAEILNPQDAGGSKSQKVFYNPVQQFNRDLSVLAIRTFAEDLAVIRRQRRERDAQKPVKHRGQKRKRGKEDDKKQIGRGAEVAPEEEHVESPGNHNDLLQAREQDEHYTEADQQRKLESVVSGGGEIVAEPRGGRDAVNGHSDRRAHRNPFRILDALSATGLRALRYAKEIPSATYITANDLSASATSSIKLNIQHNGVAGLVHPTTGDARAHMYSRTNSTRPVDQLYHVIDLDPYGTAAPFLDAALQALADGGLLCVTCTDAGVFASAGYLEKTYSQYGGLPFKGPQSHEGGLRLILHAITTSAARYGIAIEPLLSLSIDFYARLFVRIRRSPAEVKFLAGKTMLVYNCDSGCGAWTKQFLAQTKEKPAKNGDICYTYSLAQAPPADRYCEHCGFKTHLSGPMWGGPLHNPYFIQKMLDIVPDLDREVYGTVPRLEGMLTIAMNETILDDAGAQPSAADVPSDKEPLVDSPFPSLAARSPIHHHFFVLPSYLCKVLHCVAPSDAAFRGALLHLGYRTTRSHTKPGSIVTDAPWSVIWEVMREWVRQKANVKEGSVREGMAGWKIMQKARDRAPDVVKKEREELQKVVEEKCEGIGELKTKVEALLYRWSIAYGNPVCRVKTEDGLQSEEEKGRQHPMNNINTGALPKATPKASQQLSEQIDTNALTINFDEALGKDPVGKHMVRYQVNPRADWGPMNKASG